MHAQCVESVATMNVLSEFRGLSIVNGAGSTYLARAQTDRVESHKAKIHRCSKIIIFDALAIRFTVNTIARI